MLLQVAQQQPSPASASTSPDSSSTSSTSSSTKRTRVVVSQSKRGCVTCKARRVKCDELKPLCKRCIQAGRLCGGYGQTRKASPPSSSSSLSSSSAAAAAAVTGSSLQPALKTGAQVDSGTERFSHLAAHVLSLDNDGQILPEDGVWGRVFLQLSNQIDCVKAAAAAFGAAYEVWFNHDSVELSSAAWKQYGYALTQLRAAFASGSENLESIALASMILACAEIMTQHEENALNHFLGAVQVVHKTTAMLEGNKAPSSEITTIKDELVKVDILIGSYGLAQTPQIARFEGYGQFEPDDCVFREPHLASNAAMRCLYRSRQFIDAAARVRYKYPSWRDHDPAMCKAQSDLAAQCEAVLDGLATLASRLHAEEASTVASASSATRENLANIYGLRTQIAATLVYILCIHDPFQRLYDEYQDLYQSIVSDAAAASRLRRPAKARGLKRFSTRPGVVAPLFIVSMKCRDPSLRAIATGMLKEQGREGPSDGKIAAAIGARTAELETSSGIVKTASDVLDDDRIHGHGVFPEKILPGGQRVVDVEFCRPNPPLSQGWGNIDYTNTDNFSSWYEAVPI